MQKTRTMQSSPQLPRHGTNGAPSASAARHSSPAPNAFIIDDEEGICSFGATAIATGLESEADLGVLQSMGCDAAQGPFLAEPMPRSKLMWACLATAGQPWFT